MDPFAKHARYFRDALVRAVPQRSGEDIPRRLVPDAVLQKTSSEKTAAK